MNQSICDRIEDLEYKYQKNYSTIYSLVWKERNKLFMRVLTKQIKISEITKKDLDSIKLTKSETYDEIITRLLNI